MIALLITDDRVDTGVKWPEEACRNTLQLACTGDRVLVLDHAFRSDTLSTHVPFPADEARIAATLTGR